VSIGSDHILATYQLSIQKEVTIWRVTSYQFQLNFSTES